MKMARVQCLRKRLMVCSVTLLCCILLRMYYHQRYPWVWSNIPHSAIPSHPMAPYIVQENVKCSANDSTEIIPSHLPQSYKEFLRHRHCRVFPILQAPSPCGDDLYLLLAIKSTAAQVERRSALRDTWGRAGRIQGRRIKLVFLMGRSHDKVQGHDLQPLLEWENRRYSDILQWDFVDSFLNLTRKEVGFLSWFSRACSSAQFVFKGDDDVFVNTENLVEFLRAHKPTNHMLTGHIHGGSVPWRDEGTKYFVPVEMYPDGKLYPPFPSGGGYIMSRQTVLGLDVMAQKVKLFHLDDVFVGLCLREMGLNPTFHSGFLTFGFSAGHQRLGPCVYQEIMVVHKLNPVEMRVIWLLMQDSLPCA
ncbi:N-acetyllactosaminide beta-1,3-N-acetylglucosaminyltransferase 4-like [Alosa pseudoharengus]|uniref:N-acetyllactosaminide beta-1,3-N-acetylglucosaminyltransferase 4-like n=1 Tax=Alosa pseudoharengus TaxID=34774 RepID=UPI003F89A9E5